MGGTKGHGGCFSSLIDFGEWINHTVIWHYQQTSHNSTWLLTWYRIHSLSKECLSFSLHLKLTNEKCRHIVKIWMFNLSQYHKAKLISYKELAHVAKSGGLIYLPNYQRSCMLHRMYRQTSLMNCLGIKYTSKSEIFMPMKLHQCYMESSIGRTLPSANTYILSIS